MRILIVEDDVVSGRLLCAYLTPYGTCDVAFNGTEAVAATQTALAEGEPYELICMDIMMPDMNGHAALKRIRELENEARIPGAQGACIVMTSALDDSGNVFQAFASQCDGYLVKPIAKQRLLAELRKLNLLESTSVQ